MMEVGYGKQQCTMARGYAEGDSIIEKQKFKISQPQEFDSDLSTDCVMSPAKRLRQHVYEEPKQCRQAMSFNESEMSALDYTDTPESLSQISAIAPVSDMSSVQPSFVKIKPNAITTDPSWENAVSHARGEPDGAEKSFNRKKSKSSIQLETVPEGELVHCKGGSEVNFKRSKAPTRQALTKMERKRSVKVRLRNAASILKRGRSKSKLPEARVARKKLADATLADETVTTKPDTKELSKKERKQIHKALKSNYEQIQKSKQIWEEMRRSNLSQERRVELCNELLSIVKGKIKEFCFAHDTARVVQCLIQYGTEAHRDLVFDELKDEITTMAKSVYAKFLVKKILMYGSKQHRNCVYKSFHGQVRKLIRHRVAADVLECAYSEFANAHQRLSLLEEFYGPSFCLFKTPDIKCLGQIMLSQPDKREMILRNMREALLPLIDKHILVLSMVHKVFVEYFTYTDLKMKCEMTEALRDSVILMLHTKDGARVAMQTVWYGTAKDRKCIIKSFRGNVVKICQEEFGHLVLLAIFDCVDDTKIIKALLLDEMFKQLNMVAENQYGRKVLLYLLSPRDPHHFHPEIVCVLQEGDQSQTCKKERTMARYSELLEYVSVPLLQYVVEHVTSIVVNNNMLLLLLGIITHTHGDPKAAMEAISKIAAEPFYMGNTEGLHIVENPAGHMTLKRLIQNDKLRISAGKKVLFSEVLLQNLPDGTLKSWAACNPGCFTLLFLLDLEHSEITKKVVEQLKGVKQSLRKMTFKGAQYLSQKLEELKHRGSLC